jgi:hypothetical protein
MKMRKKARKEENLNKSALHPGAHRDSGNILEWTTTDLTYSEMDFQLAEI